MSDNDISNWGHINENDCLKRKSNDTVACLFVFLISIFVLIAFIEKSIVAYPRVIPDAITRGYPTM